MTSSFVPAIGEITIQQVYLCHDMPLLFSAVNPLGDRYFVSYADTDLWMMVRVSEARQAALEAGQVDIRTAFTQPECGSVIFAEYPDDEPARLSYMLGSDVALQQYLAAPDQTVRAKSA